MVQVFAVTLVVASVRPSTRTVISGAPSHWSPRARTSNHVDATGPVIAPEALPLLTIQSDDVALAVVSATTRAPTSFSASNRTVWYGGAVGVVGVQAASASMGAAMAPTARRRCQPSRVPIRTSLIPEVVGTFLEALDPPKCPIASPPLGSAERECGLGGRRAVRRHLQADVLRLARREELRPVRARARDALPPLGVQVIPHALTTPVAERSGQLIRQPVRAVLLLIVTCAT